MISVLVLMAGGNSAFSEAGYLYPKNLVEIDGKPLVQRVLVGLSSLLDRQECQLTCVISKEENRAHFLGSVIKLVRPEAKVLELPNATKGAACTALFAIDEINNDNPLVIVNGDILIQTDLNKAVEDFKDRGLDGGCIVFEDIHPRWSFVKCNNEMLVIEAAEKRPISRFATAGFYYFARGKDFVQAAMNMIRKDAQVNGLYYVCPVFNELILIGYRIGIYQIPRDAYISLATPAGVQLYESSIRATSRVS